MADIPSAGRFPLPPSAVFFWVFLGTVLFFFSGVYLSTQVKLILSTQRRVHGSPMGGTTGVSLEQGLGLTDVPRGCPGRRPGDERGYTPDYYFIIYKFNPSARDPRARLSPGS